MATTGKKSKRSGKPVSKPEVKPSTDGIDIMEDWSPAQFDNQMDCLMSVKGQLEQMNRTLKDYDIPMVHKKLNSIGLKVHAINTRMDEMQKSIDACSEINKSHETQVQKMNNSVDLAYGKISALEEAVSDMAEKCGTVNNNVTKTRIQLEDHLKRQDEKVGGALDLILVDTPSKDDVTNMFFDSEKRHLQCMDTRLNELHKAIANVKGQLTNIKDELIASFEAESKTCRMNLSKSMHTHLERKNSETVQYVNRPELERTSSFRRLFGFQSEPSEGRLNTFAGVTVQSRPREWVRDVENKV